MPRLCSTDDRCVNACRALVELYCKGESRYLGKKDLSHLHFVHHKSHMYCPAVASALRGW